MMLKCTEKNVNDKVPDVRAGDIALSDTGTGKEEGSVCSEGTRVVKEASIFALFPSSKGEGRADNGGSIIIKQLKKVNIFLGKSGPAQGHTFNVSND
jgi:hypothetical protein